MFCQQNSNCFINNCLGLKTDQLPTLPTWLSFAMAANSNPKRTSLDQLRAEDGVVASSTYSYQSFLLPVRGGVINTAQRDRVHICVVCFHAGNWCSQFYEYSPVLTTRSRTWKVLLNIVGLLVLVRPMILSSFGFASYFQAFLYHHGPAHPSRNVKAGAGCLPWFYFSFSFLYKSDSFTKRFLTRSYLVIFLIALLFWQLTSLEVLTKSTFVPLAYLLVSMLISRGNFQGWNPDMWRLEGAALVLRDSGQSCVISSTIYWLLLSQFAIWRGIQGPLLPGHNTDSKSWCTKAHTKLTIWEWSL